jgi:hypothetical protein
VQDFDSKLFLKLCVAERDMANASSMLNSRDTREIVRAVFDYAVGSTASQTAKLQVVDAAITAERDVLNGVD